MEQSGANLVEVGTTNKTHYEDYEEAITEETKALLKVHTSNYRIVGFTESVGIDELVPIAKEHGIPVVEDLGSGVLINLEKYGLTHELLYRNPLHMVLMWCVSVVTNCWAVHRPELSSVRRNILI